MTGMVPVCVLICGVGFPSPVFRLALFANICCTRRFDAHLERLIIRLGLCIVFLAFVTIVVGPASTGRTVSPSSTPASLARRTTAALALLVAGTHAAALLHAPSLFARIDRDVYVPPDRTSAVFGLVEARLGVDDGADRRFPVPGLFCRVEVPARQGMDGTKKG